MNTSHEKVVRSYLHARGFRFRLHQKKLPGKPDIVLPRFKTIVLVHGCFWHQCPYCKSGRLPKSNLKYWNAKLRRNQERDRENKEKLEGLGWRVIVIWGCQIDATNLDRRIVQRLRQTTE